MILVLSLLRVIIPSVDHPATQTAAKALPSAGIIPFLQTFYCDLTDSARNGPDGAPLFEGAKVDELYSAFAKVHYIYNMESRYRIPARVNDFIALLLTNLKEPTDRPNCNTQALYTL